MCHLFPGTREKYRNRMQTGLHLITFLGFFIVMYLGRNAFLVVFSTKGYCNAIVYFTVHNMYNYKQYLTASNSQNYVEWPTFLLMNVFSALKGSHF